MQFHRSLRLTFNLHTSPSVVRNVRTTQQETIISKSRALGQAPLVFLEAGVHTLILGSWSDLQEGPANHPATH